MIPQVNDILKVKIGAYTPSQQSINTLHYVVSSLTTGGATDQEICNYLDTSWAASYKAIMSASARYRGTSLQKIFPTPVTRPVIATSNDGVGTVASDMLPGQIAGVLSSFTVLAGQWERGRIYLPFPGEGDSDSNGFPATGYLTRATTLGSKVYAGVTVTGASGATVLEPIIWHRATTDHTTANTFTRISGYIARFGWGNQHRRGAFGQTNAPPF